MKHTVAEAETASQWMSFYVLIRLVPFIRGCRGKRRVVVYGMGTADAGKNIAEGANLYKQRVEMLIGSSNAGNNW